MNSNYHRFTLRRDWIGSGGRVNWIMLNPSTADDKFDDPTIRKCVGFTKRWGYSGIVVTNLFAFRATDPKDLRWLIRDGKQDLALGEGNDESIANAANESDLVVMAWGANAAWCPERVASVMSMFLVPSCIALTKGGYPVHPCMAAYTDGPLPFRYAGAALQPKAEPQEKRGMLMSEVRPGMRLRSTLEIEHGGPREFITVADLTKRGFTYSLDAEIPLGARLGVELKDGHEHFGIVGFALYTPAAETKKCPAS